MDETKAEQTEETKPSRLTAIYREIRFEGDGGAETIGIAFSPVRVQPIVRVTCMSEWVAIGDGDGEFSLTRLEAGILAERLACFSRTGSLVEPVPTANGCNGGQS